MYIKFVPSIPSYINQRKRRTYVKSCTVEFGIIVSIKNKILCLLTNLKRANLALNFVLSHCFNKNDMSN